MTAHCNRELATFVLLWEMNEPLDVYVRPACLRCGLIRSLGGQCPSLVQQLSLSTRSLLSLFYSIYLSPRYSVCRAASNNMSWLDAIITLPVSSEEMRNGQLLLDEIRSLRSLNAILFDHMRVALVPAGAARALPRNTHIQAGKQAQSDGRMLELYMGMLFHCMGFTVLSCGGGPADGGVDVKVEDHKGNIVAIQCKQYSRAVVGYNVGLQLIGAMYTTGSTVGVLITPSTASQDVKVLARSMQDIRHGELRLHVWEAEHLIRLLGRWSAEIIETRAAMLDDVLSDVGLCDRIIASQPHGYCIRHAIYLPRGDGECDKNCSPISQRLHPLLTFPRAFTIPPSSTCQSSPPTSSVLLSSTKASISLLSAYQDKDGDIAEVLETISSDDDADYDDDVNKVITNRKDNNVQLSLTARGRTWSTPTRQTTPMSASRSPFAWSHASVPQTAPVCSTIARSQSAILWTEEEEDELRRCVLLVGEGRWTDILETSDLLRTKGKTAIKIRDKWKNMRKRQLRTCTQLQYNP